VFCPFVIYFCAVVAHWDGHTDLEVRFLVTDLQTYAPIPNATIHISAEPNESCCTPSKKQFTITTDQDGIARQIANDCHSSGTKGLFVDTFFSELPAWTYRVTATGYFESSPQIMEQSSPVERVQQAQSLAILMVVIPLRKQSD